MTAERIPAEPREHELELNRAAVTIARSHGAAPVGVRFSFVSGFLPLYLSPRANGRGFFLPVERGCMSMASSPSAQQNPSNSRPAVVPSAAVPGATQAGFHSPHRTREGAER